MTPLLASYIVQAAGALFAVPAAAGAAYAAAHAQAARRPVGDQRRRADHGGDHGHQANVQITHMAQLVGHHSLQLVAIHVHVGSQITTIEPLARAAAVLAGVAGEMRRAGITLEYVDVGGGLGISYDGRDVVPVAAYGAAIVDAIAPTGLPLVVEPGRAIAGPSGVLVARVIDLKPRDATSESLPTPRI